MMVLDEKNPHTRNTRDGMMIKWDGNYGVHTMCMWICSMKQGQFSAGRDSEWSE